MTFLKTLGLIVPLLFSATSWADTLKINPNHPDQYTVVKGDTLWDISGKFLQNPWQWPKLWSGNPQIKNPHLIYPGNTLYFSMVNGQPHLSFSKDFQLKPRIRESSFGQAIKQIPTDAIAQFLTSPKVLGENDLEQSPYVVAFAGEHLIAGAGDRIYVRAIENPRSLSYTIYRKGETYVNPITKEVLGYEARYIADTTIEKAGDPATLSVTKANNEIRLGDRLMEGTTNKFSLNFFPHPPEKNIDANIISVLGGVTQIGQHNVIVIDKGISDGLEVGHILDIHTRGKIVKDSFANQKNTTVKLPDELAGLLIVFRPFYRVSYALVLEASQAIHVLDKAHTP